MVGTRLSGPAVLGDTAFVSSKGTAFMKRAAGETKRRRHKIENTATAHLRGEEKISREE
jgi:hypothetical protein